MRYEIVTCALFLTDNLCFGPSFIRPEGTNPKNVYPETTSEIATVVFYLGMAECIGLNAKDKTAVAERYGIQSRLSFLINSEEESRKKILFGESYLKKQITQEFKQGKN